ncbi:MAG: hypothetical protein U0768_17990 [Anaerolineae bacterium]
MTSLVRAATPHFDSTAIIRGFLVLAIVLIVVAGAAWFALTPVAVSDTSGAVTRTWVEATADGAPAAYWVEIREGRGTSRCSIAAYQTQLLTEWQALQPGDTATMTCYGQTAVSLTR